MKKKRLLSLILIFSLMVSSITGCNKETAPEKNVITEEMQQEARTQFDNLANEAFLTAVQTDSITLNYKVAHPENYGIESLTPTFGEFSIDIMKKNLAQCENYIERLTAINFDALSDEQKLTYNIMKDYYAVEPNTDDLLYYYEQLSPTTGLQAQLPTVLAEYSFRTKDDINTYLKLLPKLPSYFNQILDFENQKSEAGLFMCDEVVDKIVAQCEAFIATKDKNFLITIFNNKIDAFEGLTKKEKKSFKSKNKACIIDSVIPAYQLLIDGLNALKGTGKNEGGLCNFEKGKEYYEQLIKTDTGSSRSVTELLELIKSYISNHTKNMISLLKKDNSLLSKVEKPTYPLSDPQKILSFLSEKIKTDFPEMNPVNETIKNVDKSLEEFISPAFYLANPIDDYSNNTIYVNNSSLNPTNMFTTIAHEGYPGHLYQTVYFSQQNPDPIREVFNFSGYTEGWATYVEMQSFHMAGLDSNIATVLEDNSIINLLVMARTDIGINYEGWDLNDCIKYLSNLYGSQDEAYKDIYYTLVAEPGCYLPYVIGYIEMAEMRKKAEKKLGDKFSAKEYHQFILQTGPCQFELLNTYLDEWIQVQKAAK